MVLGRQGPLAALGILKIIESGLVLSENGSILKRQSGTPYTENELCTNTPDGINNDSSNYITWCKPTVNVKTVELIFRDKQHAHINDLKILYFPE